MDGTAPLRLAVLPDDDGHVSQVAARAGAHVVPIEDANALAWTTAETAGFPELLPAEVRWVQLFSAGIERWFDAGIIDERRVWTSAVGAYAQPVAEHALMLLLAGVRQLGDCVRADSWTKPVVSPRMGTLAGARIGILGAGGIARALIPSLRALGAETLAVNRSGAHVPGASETRSATDLGDFWAEVHHVVVAAPQTSSTRGLVGEKELDAMRSSAWLVNVARGALVDTDALVRALDAGAIGGAALDVTDPEPLPADHPLWHHPRAIITPHVANPAATLRLGFDNRLTENIRRWTAGDPLVGLVDVGRGY